MGLWLLGFAEWHNKHVREISWFFIGFFFVSLLSDVRTGNYVWAIIDTVLILINYWTYKKETKNS